MYLASEVFRQINLLKSGQAVSQDTRGFDEDKAETFKLRSKEDAPDYRYMPDPNLPPLLINQVMTLFCIGSSVNHKVVSFRLSCMLDILQEYITRIRQSMPELPGSMRQRLYNRGLSARDAEVLMSVDSGREVGFDGEPGSGGAVAYFDSLSIGRDAKVVVNWWV
jgi:aspartyl-tRNA(Asn)/glutamyl-tRNA(Gln) amidotransferase subunit B